MSPIKGLSEVNNYLTKQVRALQWQVKELNQLQQHISAKKGVEVNG